MALIATETLAAWRARFVALDDMLAGMVQSFDQMLRDLPRDAVLELTPELAATLIASISANEATCVGWDSSLLPRHQTNYADVDHSDRRRTVSGDSD